MHQQMHFSRVILLKIFVHFNPMNHAAGQHAIRLPALIILQEMTYQKCTEAPQKGPEITPDWMRSGSGLCTDTLRNLVVLNKGG